MKPFKTASDPIFREAVVEDIAHAYYKNSKTSLHPWKGETEPDYTEWHEDKKYTWVKAPRFQGKPTQVGPLSQILVGYAQGHRAHREVDRRRARQDLSRSRTQNHGQ